MNTFGRIFRVSLFGESHGNGVGVLLDGVPAGLPLSEGDLMEDLGRRKSGAAGTTPRKEEDKPSIVSGVFEGTTTGAPILITFENNNTRSRDYGELRKTPRPGHADFTASVKYGGYEDYRGGGHFSGRLTLGLVAAGTVAKKLIDPVTVTSTLIEAGGRSDIEEAIAEAVKSEDSIGGIISCSIMNLPTGLGEPFFDSFESVMSHIVFAIPAIKGIEFGSGFGAAKMKGSEHNDNIIGKDGRTETNYAGGINGGITNGNEVHFRIAVKPTSSTHQSQRTLNFSTNKIQDLVVEGRHDTCIALRIPVVLEASAAIVTADMMLLEQKIDRRINPKQSLG